MRRRRLARVFAAVWIVGLLVAGSGSIAIHWWARPRLLESGGVAVVVEGRDLDPASNRYGLGTGIHGMLGVVGGRCVGFLDLGDGAAGEGTVIVWPPGTTVEGSGQDVQITSQGKSVRLGQTIDAGADLRRRFAELDDLIPEECRDLPRIPVGLNS